VGGRPRRRRSNSERAVSQTARLRRLARYEEVVACYTQGMSIIGIAEQFHMSRTTVRKLVAAGAFPERATTLRTKSVLDPYTSYLEQRVVDGCHNASLLWREIHAQGFPGGYSVVKKWLEGRREKPGRLSSKREQAQKKAFFAETEESRSSCIQELSQPLVAPEKTEAAILLDVPLESPRHLVWLLLRDPSSLDRQEQQMLAFIRQEQAIEVAYELAQQFGGMVRKRQRDQLDAWITACLASGIPDLETFATGLQKDYAAIKAALTFPYSNGPVEGQVNRLKFIKRSMYGRGGFELLRQRVLSSA
jgi:transposase